jgi:CHASE2 domain-containing sensor protein/two-component sensor histidine kinase
VVIGLIIAARLTGSLQSLELLALDTFLRLRPGEPEDDRIILVGLNETDIQKLGYPIPEKELVGLLTTLQTYKPTVIGLHILSNQVLPTQTAPNQISSDQGSPNQNIAPSGKQLADLSHQKNLIVAEKILVAADQALPPSGFGEEQVGLIDVILDGHDGHLRRVVLGAFDPIKVDVYRKSLVIQLVEAYLTSQDSTLTLQNGIRDKFAMRFGATELPRLFPDSGGYVRANTGGPQMLLNVRMGKRPFRMLSLAEIQAGTVDPQWLRDRIVLVGITDPAIRPSIPTAATAPTNSLDIQAHSVSQILSAVLDRRPLIDTWSKEWEYLWILAWGCLGMMLGHHNFVPRHKLIAITIAQLLLISIGHMLLMGGVWIPIIPVSLVWLMNGLGYTAFYKYDWVLRSRLKENQRMAQERQRAIEETFNIIHNGPLQTLASLLRQSHDDALSQEQIRLALEKLNAEIRGIGEHLKQESLHPQGNLYLGDGITVDLNLPLHELFYEVYSNTLDRPDFSRFEMLKIACDFEPIEAPMFNFDQKQDLCRFLEEALCNVGKHAEGATRLTVTGSHQNDWYTLQIMDNGVGLRSTREGEGTKQARQVASRVKGKFRRVSLSPKGTLCELTLPLIKSWLRS